MKLLIRSVMFALLALVVPRQARCTGFDSIPSYFDLKEGDVAAQKALVVSLRALATQPLETIAEELSKHEQRLASSPSMESADEMMKVYLLCGMVFEFPKTRVAEAEKKMFPPGGMFFSSEKPLPKDEMVDAILPMYLNKSGMFEIRYFFKGYTGPQLRFKGVEVFSYFRDRLPLRKL